MKTIQFVLASVLALTVLSACKSSSKRSGDDNNTTPQYQQPATDYPSTIAPSTSSVVGSTYYQSIACKIGFIPSVLQFLGNICIDQVYFTDVSNVSFKIGDLSVTSTYTLNADTIQISMRNAKRNDDGKSLGFGTLVLIVSSDFASMTDKQKRILTRR